MSEHSPAMPYMRPTNDKPLSKQVKLRLLAEYVAYYRDAASADGAALNQKIPRDAFAELLDRIGTFLLDESARLAITPGPVRAFLAANPPPEGGDGDGALDGEALSTRVKRNMLLVSAGWGTQGVRMVRSLLDTRYVAGRRGLRCLEPPQGGALRGMRRSTLDPRRSVSPRGEPTRPRAQAAGVVPRCLPLPPPP